MKGYSGTLGVAFTIKEQRGFVCEQFDSLCCGCCELLSHIQDSIMNSSLKKALAKKANGALQGPVASIVFRTLRILGVYGNV